MTVIVLYVCLYVIYSLVLKLLSHHLIPLLSIDLYFQTNGLYIELK